MSVTEDALLNLTQHNEITIHLSGGIQLDIQTENFLSILKTAIHGEPISLHQPADYREILAIAKSHNLHPLVGEVLCGWSDFVSSQEYDRTVSVVISQTGAQMMRTNVFLELYRALAEKGIRPIVMKGIVCRQLYGEYCDHRPSADEDILVQKGEFEKVQKVMLSYGFRLEREETEITEKQLEELQEITFYDDASGLYIEVHTNPIGREIDLRREMNDCFADVFDEPRSLTIEGTEILTMNHTDHFLFLILHAFKHMMTSGFGIRQVLDILLYQEQFMGEIAWPYIYRQLKKIGAEEFYADLISIGNRYLGFSLTSPFKPNCPDILLEDLMGNGVFGNETQAQMTSIQMTLAAVENRESGGKVKILLKTIFPARSRMLALNPELADKPWLLPVCWGKRWLRFLKHNRENGGNLAAESMEVSRRRIELLKKYKIL